MTPLPPQTPDDTAGSEAIQRAAAFRSDLRGFLAEVAHVTAKAGLTPQRYDLILTIKDALIRGVPVTVGSLCQSLDLQQPAVSELVQRVEQAGLVSRTRATHDRRVVHLELTAEGEARLGAVLRALDARSPALEGAFDRLGRSFHAARPPA